MHPHLGIHHVRPRVIQPRAQHLVDRDLGSLVYMQLDVDLLAVCRIDRLRQGHLGLFKALAQVVALHRVSIARERN